MSEPIVSAFLGEPVADENELQLQRLLTSLRQHIGMDFAFISKFTDTERVMEIIDTAPSRKTGPKPGASDKRKETYCQKIVDGELPELIPDTRANKITTNMTVTKTLSIGSYIGVPVFLDKQELYGTLCCFDSEPVDHLTERDVAFLKVMADFIGNVLNKRVSEERRIHCTREEILSLVNDDKVDIVFQPVLEADGITPYCYEALARFNTSPYRPPNVWLDEAESVQLGIEIETAIIKKTLSYLHNTALHPTNFKVSLNVSPMMITSGALLPLLKDTNPDNLQIEITEHSEIEDYEMFSAYLVPFINMGFDIAVDDVGAGFASLRHILELKASVIKLDISLVSNIAEDEKRQALVTALVAFAKLSNLKTVAEGVEKHEEFTTLKTLGVELFQGFYFARPAPLTPSLMAAT